jgi:methylmalonyl-CoA/ethylmalonyl-CoA epimerase
MTVDMGTLSKVPLINDANGKPGQLGIVVRDLDAALRIWGAQNHIAPGWRVAVYDSANFATSYFRGQEDSRFSMLVALGGADPNIELIQPLSGRTIYDEWLEEKGEGLNHVGFYVPDVAESIARMTQAGYELVQSGTGTRPDGTGGFAYFDTVDIFGYYVEAIQARNT